MAGVNNNKFKEQYKEINKNTPAESVLQDEREYEIDNEFIYFGDEKNVALNHKSYVVEPFMDEKQEIEAYAKSLDINEEDDNSSHDLDDYNKENLVNDYEVEQYKLRPELELRIKNLINHFTNDTEEAGLNLNEQTEYDFKNSFSEEISETQYEKSEEETFAIDDDYSLEDELLNEKEVARLGSKAINVFKSRGYSIILKKIKNIDFLALNIIKVDDNLKAINILPVKISNLKGSIIVSENEYGYNPFSETFETKRMVVNELFDNIEKVMKKSQNQTFKDLTSENSLFLYIKKKFDHKLKIERTKNKKNILIRAGPIRYKLIIDPLLICKKEVQFEEKLISFPYKRESNIHYVELEALNNLLEFLEKKYYLIEDNSEDKNSVKKYFKMKNKLITDAGKYSIPFIAIPSVLLLLMVLVPSLSSFSLNLSLAVIVIYGITLGYLYLGFFKKKGEFIKLFNTPYHQRPVDLDETDLEIIRGMVSLESLEQLIYECFGKKADLEIIASLEEEKSNFIIEEEPINSLDSPGIKGKKFSDEKEKDTIISNYGRLLEDLD